MLKWLNVICWFKKSVFLRSWQMAENRYSIFVWMRQVNDRLLRLENRESEQTVQQRAEQEAFYEAKLQTLQAQILQLQDLLAGKVDRHEKKEVSCAE